jgi:hypothetical protein
VTTPYDRLTAAQERIRDPQRWTRGISARTKTSAPCNAEDTEACQWCAFGSINSVGDHDRKGLDLANIAAFTLFNANLVVVNDRHGHDAIMQVFTKARELALEEANTV